METKNEVSLSQDVDIGNPSLCVIHLVSFVADDKPMSSRDGQHETVVCLAHRRGVEDGGHRRGRNAGKDIRLDFGFRKRNNFADKPNAAVCVGKQAHTDHRPSGNDSQSIQGPLCPLS